jgi:hypothetical protein
MRGNLGSTSPRVADFEFLLRSFVRTESHGLSREAFLSLFRLPMRK